jgi:hypothetical protein
MHGRIEEAAQADAVLFASGPATRELWRDRGYLSRFRLDPSRQLVGSMCSGALLLHALGLVAGKRATTHPTVVDLLRAEGVDVIPAPFVREGNVATAAACLAGVDLASWVIASLVGEDAREAALAGMRPVASAPSAARSASGSDATYRGSCLCGSVRYEVDGELGDFGYCHCASCRKASGTAYGANVPVERARFRLVSGAATLREYASSTGKRRAFCSACGSPIYAYLEASPDVLRLRLGSLDTPFTRTPRAHTWVSDKAPWEPIEGTVPQFPEWAPRSVLEQRGSRQPR